MSKQREVLFKQGQTLSPVIESVLIVIGSLIQISGLSLISKVECKLQLQGYLAEDVQVLAR